MHRSLKMSRRSPERHISIWTRPAAVSDRICFSLPRTPNSFISRHRSDVSSFKLLSQTMTTVAYGFSGNKRHVFGAKTWPTCANYALHQLAKDNAVNNEIFVRMVQRNFYVDDFLKSVRTPQEAIEIYQKVRDILIKGGFNLTK